MTTEALDHLKEAIVHELDRSLQHTYHQRLSEVLVDLRVHYAPVSSAPRPDEIASLMLHRGVLDRPSEPALAELRETFERWEHGLLGICVRCGKEIPMPVLGRHPTAARCPSCDRQTSSPLHSF